MNRFHRFVFAAAILLLVGASALYAQEVTFSAGPSTGALNLQGLGFSWADVNQDGRLDLFVEPDNLVINNGTSFTRKNAGFTGNSQTVGSVFADVNGDGYPDLFVTQGSLAPKLYTYNPATGLYEDATASFGDLATVSSGTNGQMYNVAVGDYNRDGYLDVAWGGAANQTAVTNGHPRLLKGSAAGFVNVSGTAAFDTSRYFESWNPAFVDANNDGYPDLWLPSLRNNLPTGGSRSVLYLNDGAGNFVPVPKALYAGPADTGLVVDDTVRHYSAIASTWGDFNNDGIPDLLVSALSADATALHILQGNGNGTFHDITATSGVTYNSSARGIGVGDYNNDGLLDIFEGAGFAPPKVWRNNGNGTFTDVSSIVNMPASGVNSRSALLVDINGDGFLDFYSVAGGGDYLFLNSGNLNNWIAFRPIGAGHNMSAIGARFTIYTDGGTKKQIRDIEGGGSGGATGGHVVANFGLGLATTVDSVVILWPDGVKQKLTGLAVNKYWTVQEGSTVPAVPTLATPANGASGVAQAATLTWNASVGAASYKLQVSLDATFADANAVVFDGAVAGTSHAVALGAASTYYWRVAAVNGGFTSAYSAVSSFTTAGSAAVAVPTIVAPVSGSTGLAGVLTLVVNKTADAAQYKWQISTLPSFAGFTVNENSVDTAHTVSLVPGRTYYLRVAGVNGAGASAFSAVDTFSVMAAPAVPGLVSPANNDVNVRRDTLKFTWRAVAGATHYVLQVGRGASNFEMAIITNDVTDTTATLTGLANMTVYYWRVRAYNAGGTSLYSSANGFTTIIAAPAAPALVSPKSTIDEPRNTRFVWNSVINATKYRLQIATNNSFSAVVIDTTLKFDTTFTVAAAHPLDAATDYFWQVASINVGGQGAWSTAAHYTTGDSVSGAAPLAGGLPREYGLSQNYPNPFNPTTRIVYDLPKNARVSITIFDVLGREVAKLVDGIQAADRYVVEWNASHMASGVYFYRMVAQNTDGSGNFTSTKKLLLMK